jgi:hypothetical protein
MGHAASSGHSAWSLLPDLGGAQRKALRPAVYLRFLWTRGPQPCRGIQPAALTACACFRRLRASASPARNRLKQAQAVRGQPCPAYNEPLPCTNMCPLRHTQVSPYQCGVSLLPAPAVR